jgi:hypothetical protein
MHPNDPRTDAEIAAQYSSEASVGEHIAPPILLSNQSRSPALLLFV